MWIKDLENITHVYHEIWAWPQSCSQLSRAQHCLETAMICTTSLTMLLFLMWLERCGEATLSIEKIYFVLNGLRTEVMCPKYKLSSVQPSHSVISDSATPWIPARQASLSITNYSSQTLLKLMSIESVMPSNHLILCHPLLLLPTIPPSMRIFSNESTLHMRWPKYWSFSFSISPSNEHPGLISFRMDWLDLLAVQRTLKSLLHHHSSKASIPWLIHINVWQKSLQYYKVISLQLIEINEKKYKSINSSVFNFLHSPTLTSIHDYWRNHSLD